MGPIEPELYSINPYKFWQRILFQTYINTYILENQSGTSNPFSRHKQINPTFKHVQILHICLNRPKIRMERDKIKKK